MRQVKIIGDTQNFILDKPTPPPLKEWFYERGDRTTSQEIYNALGNYILDRLVEEPGLENVDIVFTVPGIRAPMRASFDIVTLGQILPAET